MVICLERGTDLHMVQLMPLPLTVSCSSKIQIGFTFLVAAYPGCPGKEAVKWLLLLFLVLEMSVDNKNCLNFVKIIAGLPGRVVYITCIPMTCCGEIWGWFRVVRGTQGHGQCHHLIERIRRSTTNVSRSLCCRCWLAVSVVAALWSTFISTNGHKCYKILIFIGSTYDAAITETIHR